MAISNFSSANWRASALIFSGRSNPEWPLTDEAAQQLISLWSTLPPAPAARPTASGLGYHGCRLEDAQRHWHAFDGVAVMSSGSQSETRNDLQRAFERALLATAPPGKIPEGFRIA